ncbi:MAG: chromosomal replication initiator protein DnaA [Chloroflexi bacterium]|nr:chromosomal replication initiator protein DnaA [Chloroflexota bacterium]
MKDQLLEIWQNCLIHLEKEVPRPSFDTWLRPTKLVSIFENTLLIAAPNQIAREQLETRYLPLIQETLRKVSGQQQLGIKFVVPQVYYDPSQETAAAALTSEQLAVRAKDDSFSLNLNHKYSFDSFVVGENNRFAHAAALAVAEAPGRSYNPLFIYGGVGLGKTHLMQAIGRYVLSTRSFLKVAYISSETFTNEFINAIMANRTSDFRNRYRSVDVLLVDDIQFLAGKEQTQEEFFHTFNALHESTKQLVISSDRPPKDIPTLEDRLRSRFEWGLITDIQPPDLETRIAILRKKTKLENLTVPDDVLLFIANTISPNIRELEGALIRINAYCSLTNSPVTMESATQILKDILPRLTVRPISIEDVQQEVARHFRLSMEDMKAKRRNRNVSFPRQIAMYLSRKLTDFSLPRIGEAFGGRDHTTVLHAWDKIIEDLKSDPALKATITLLEENLRKDKG